MIKPFLEAHRAEVKGMLLTEYNEAETMELFKEDGRREERVTAIHNLMKKLKMTAEQAMEVLGIPVSERSSYMSML